MDFFDIQIIRGYKKFNLSVYRKPTLRGVFTHFESILPLTYKFGTVYKLAYRCFQISIWTKLNDQLLFLKQIFL